MNALLKSWILMATPLRILYSFYENQGLESVQFCIIPQVIEEIFSKENAEK